MNNESRCARLLQVGPASLEVVRAGTQAHRRWAYYLTLYHYLRLRVLGQNLGYLAREQSGREVGALLLGAPVWRCAGRNRYLKDRGFCPQKGLARIANNTRFLIFPRVKVPYLASHILGAVARRIDGDWQEKYGQGLEWLETFVERGRFAGTCYRAANWVHVGRTCGRGRQDRKHTTVVPEKDVYLLGIKS